MMEGGKSWNLNSASQPSAVVLRAEDENGEGSAFSCHLFSFQSLNFVRKLVPYLAIGFDPSGPWRGFLTANEHRQRNEKGKKIQIMITIVTKRRVIQLEMWLFFFACFCLYFSVLVCPFFIPIVSENFLPCLQQKWRFMNIRVNGDTGK
eukprot:gene12039-8292_t